VVELGLYLKNKTNYIAYNTIGAAILNIALNFLFIPKYKMIGAAVATIISFLALYLASYFATNKFYKISYENLKLVKMLVLTIGLFFLSNLIANSNILVRIGLKIAIIISFPFILYPMNFYEPIEIQTIKGAWRKWRNPLNWKKNRSKIKLDRK
jgi:O-antigen/teichoic acid export membrane protein